MGGRGVSMRDPYQVLGLTRSSSQDEIKSAYRRLAKKMHPDLNPGKPEIERQFKDITAAYDLLSDPGKRGRFDRGEIDASGAEQRGGFWRSRAGRGRAPFESAAGGVETEDLFEEFIRTATRGRRGERKGGPFGRGGTDSAQPQRGADVKVPLTIAFLEAARGVKKRVALPDGKTVELVVPAGTEDGQQMRLKGQGRAGIAGGEPGDAFIDIAVEPHPLFERKGKDLHLHLPVSLAEAVLGAAVTVPTLSGKVTLRIPKGSNGGTMLRLKGKGFSDAKGSLVGDQYVHLRLMVPEPSDPELEKFLERWKPRAYEPRKRAGLDQ